MLDVIHQSLKSKLTSLFLKDCFPVVACAVDSVVVWANQNTINNNNLKKIPNFKVVLLQPNQKIIDLTLANNEEQYVNRLINISKPKMYKDTQVLFVWPEGILSNLDNSKNYKKLFHTLKLLFFWKLFRKYN